jgi:two-component system chemotaxis response regulator CheY
MVATRVLSVGQCAADHFTLSRLLRDRFGAEVDAADTPRDAFDQLRRHRYDLVLVNRLLARDGSGQDLIARLKDDPSLGRVPVMLVSNFAEAQQQAVADGALPGFGKAALDDPETWQRLETALSGASTAEGAHRP